VLATAALALNQVDRVIRAVRRGDDVGTSAEWPPTLDTTLESTSTLARSWRADGHGIPVAGAENVCCQVSAVRTDSSWMMVR
jgi:hypothetical protein